MSRFGIATRVRCRTDALDRGVRVGNGFAVEVAAPLGVDLVLDVETGNAGILERLNGPGDVHRLAKTGIRIDERRQVGHPRDLAATVRHLGERGQPDVGQPEVSRDDRA